MTTLFKLAFTQNQVKEITDDCQTVKWESCVLEPTEVPFDVPKVTCKPDDYYKTLKRVEVEQPIELNQMKCKVLETTACKPVEREVVSQKSHSTLFETLFESFVMQCIKRASPLLIFSKFQVQHNRLPGVHRSFG